MAGTIKNWMTAHMIISSTTTPTNIMILRFGFCGPITFTVGIPTGVGAAEGVGALGVDGIGGTVVTGPDGLANISSGLKVCGVTPDPPDDCMDFMSLSIVRMPISGGGGGGTLPETDGGIPGPIGLIGCGVGIGGTGIGVGVGGVGGGGGVGTTGGGVGIGGGGGGGMFDCPPF